MKEKKIKNPISCIEDLKTGKLSEIMSYYMLNDSKEQDDFLKIVQKNKGKHKKLLKDYNTFYGYKLHEDLIELEETFDAYFEYFESVSDVWMLEGGISYVSKLLKKKPDSGMFNDWEFILTILTGLEMFGSDPCGDSCFIDTLPNPFDTTQVLVYDHETGEPSGYTAFSIADFISDKWSLSYDYETEEETEKNTDDINKIIKIFNKEAKKTGENRPYYNTPIGLFKRVHWLLGHPTGEPTYEFASKLSDAPKFADWEKEKELITTVPVLANYWLFAHYFMGNNNACTELISLAKQSKSLVTKILAEIIESLIKKPKKAKLGNLNSKDLSKILNETRKNCLPEHLEPERRTEIQKERGEDKIKKISDREFKKRIKEGTDPMTFIEEFPEDVAMHDKVLKIIGEQDEQFGKLVDRYLKQKSGDAYDKWPYNSKDLDTRLSLPVSAAFISGLKYDESHKLANAGITRTLGKFDDDNAMNAYHEALKKLNPDDERIEYLLKDLENSKHPRKNELLIFAAQKLFDLLEKAKENEDKLKKRREKEGMTLDNMFDTENHFLHPVSLVLMMNNDESVKIADEILNNREMFKIFKRTLGDAFRIAGNKKMTRHTDYLKRFVQLVGEIQANDDGFIENVTLYNFSEACIALTKLEPEIAEKTLNELFNRTTNAKFLDLDIKSGTIAGLLILKPKDKNLLIWLERLLGNRDNNPRLCGVLRAVAEAKPEEAHDWAVYHLYSDINSFMPGHSVIKRLAREAVNALCKPDLPDFDDENKYATNLQAYQLPEAFNHPEKYDPAHICKRIVEEKYIHKDALNSVKKYLIDLLKFSDDDKDTPDLWKGFKALAVQGQDALEVFAELLKLPHISSQIYTDIIYVMRTVEPEAKIREWLYTASEQEVLKQLKEPEARFIPWLDLLAAHAFCSYKENAESAIKDAFNYRYKMISNSYDSEEPTMVRIPLVYAAYGKEPKSYMNKFVAQLKQAYNAQDIIKGVLKRDFKVKPVKVEESTKIILSNKIKGEDWSCPVYEIKVEYKDEKVSFTCKVEELGFQSFIEDGKLESKGSVTCNSVEEAKKLTQLIVKECLLIQYK